MKRILGRWRMSRWQFAYELQFTPVFWRVRKLQKRLSFWVRARFYYGDASVQSGHAIGSLFIEFLRMILPQLLLAGTIIGVLELVERFLLPYIPLPHVAGWPTVILELAARLIRRVTILQTADISLLSSLAQLSAVFLGLYFAALSVVASTVYAPVPSNVRGLLLRDPVGRFYFRLVAQTGAASLMLLTIDNLSLNHGVLSLLYVSMLGAASIIGFPMLGARTFHFFNPTRLAEIFISDSRQWIQSATSRGFHWLDPSFQAYYQKRAEELLIAFQSISQVVARDQSARAGDASDLALLALGLMRYYAIEKAGIPTDSEWFKRVPHHRDWFITDYSQTSIALQTGTPLLPELSHRANWFESYIQKIVSRVVTTLIEQQEYAACLNILIGIQETLELMGSRLCVDEALQLYGTLGASIRTVANCVDLQSQAKEADPDQLEVLIGLLDIYGLSLINLFLGFSQRMLSTTPESVRRMIEHLNWNDPGGSLLDWTPPLRHQPR